MDGYPYQKVIKQFPLYRRFFIVTLIFFSASFTIRSQEMLGTTLGNYAGINNVQLNPSGMLGSRQWLDIQLAGGDLSFQSNYLYLSKREFVFWDLFKTGFVLPSHNEDYGTEVRNFYRYDNARRKNLMIHLRVNGPGAMLIWKDHAFGVHTSFRSFSSLRRIPNDVANFIYLGLNYRPQQNVNYRSDKRTHLAQMTWFEAGLSYAYKLYGRGFDRIDAGLSLRRLFGLTGMYAVATDLDYLVLDDSTLQINNIKADFGLSLPVEYQVNTPGFSADPLIAGGGWGIDLGVTYTRLKRTHQKQYIDRLCEQKHEDYLYRIGLSLIDAGGIKFTERALSYSIDNQSSYWEHLTRLDFQSIDQLLDTISYEFYGDPATAYRRDYFTLWLPSALSAQFDYHYLNNWYFNAVMILPFRFSKISLTRPALLAIAPRYESRWFEASLPISFYDWYQLRLGLSLRLYILTIGTEKLGPYLGFSNFNGMDFYFSIKIPLEKGVCGWRVSKSCPVYEDFEPHDL